MLLAKDEEGHKQIRQLSTRAYSHSFMKNKMRRVPTYYSDLEEIIGENRGHLIASTACIGGYIGRQLLKIRDNPDCQEEIIHKLSMAVYYLHSYGILNYNPLITKTNFM